MPLKVKQWKSKHKSMNIDVNRWTSMKTMIAQWQICENQWKQLDLNDKSMINQWNIAEKQWKHNDESMTHPWKYVNINENQWNIYGNQRNIDEHQWSIYEQQWCINVIDEISMIINEISMTSKWTKNNENNRHQWYINAKSMKHQCKSITCTLIINGNWWESININ